MVLLLEKTTFNENKCDQVCLQVFFLFIGFLIRQNIIDLILSVAVETNSLPIGFQFNLLYVLYSNIQIGKCISLYALGNALTFVTIIATSGF